jgi:hypothetical protein
LESPAFSPFYIFHFNSTALIEDFASPTARHHFCRPCADPQAALAGTITVLWNE